MHRAPGYLTCYLHIGMHKTGTSSIQESLAASRQNHVRVFPWPDSKGNHGGNLLTLFDPEPWRLRKHRLVNRNRHDVFQMREKLRTDLHNDLAAFRSDPDVACIVFTAEQLSHPNYFKEPALSALRDEFFQFSEQISVVGYVRAPHSFIESDFQQVLKMGGPATLDLHGHWPHYRRRFARMDTVFGRENVLLRKFDRSLLHKGDVTRDFAAIVGWAENDLDVRRTNEGVGLEALALLYAMRRAGYGEGGHDMAAVTLSFYLAEQLDQLSRHKLSFAPELTGNLLDAHADDTRWAEHRIGATLYEGAKTGNAIHRENDLLDLASDLCGDLGQIELTPPSEHAQFLETYPDITTGLLQTWVQEGLSA